MWHDSDVMPAARILLQLIADFVVYLGLLVRPRKAIAAENLFLRRQLALYQEHKVDPRRIDPATRITLALLSRLFNWRDALIVRECLDWAIPLSEGHLRSLLKMWSPYYNRGRLHMALGPGVPDPPRGVQRHCDVIGIP